ncbi:dienelactone hydrolase family protein [Legionella quateirensis]|uniref:Dienelactone hydrolase family protein n=1 Tax=Legionella quateirensis TaxID=45072 RepID=A0A378KXP9_9GAMM|nr:dienelactone hydrolase family protein [Legionella quateirensis]KTD52757.1 dienelactone hydrolase family protein [Legionella quateirensis]STY19176.1 dienelactone hydrolase family protein [Legionella quateirensis]
MIVTNEIEYMDGKTVCRGFIAYDSNLTQPLSAVMVVHDWVGRSETFCNKARQLAALGYVGFAVDMYGQARTGADKTERRALMAPLMQDRSKLAARINAAVDVLTQLPCVDKTNIAAIGYCFGGLCVLDLARSQADVKGVVCFHGLLTSPEHSNYQPINSKILILHGYDDPLVKPDQISHIAGEMNERKADWQIHMYGHTQHSFTNPEANDDEMGLHYNESADHRSWITTLDFLRELFL